LAGENFGGFGSSLPIHQSFIHQKVMRSQLNSECILSTTKVFSTNFLAVPTPPKFSPTKVLCYTVVGIDPKNGVQNFGVSKIHLRIGFTQKIN